MALLRRRHRSCGRIRSPRVAVSPAKTPLRRPVAPSGTRAGLRWGPALRHRCRACLHGRHLHGRGILFGSSRHRHARLWLRGHRHLRPLGDVYALEAAVDTAEDLRQRQGKRVYSTIHRRDDREYDVLFGQYCLSHTGNQNPATINETRALLPLTLNLRSTFSTPTHRRPCHIR